MSVSEHDVIASSGIIPTSAYAGGLHFHIDVPDTITSFSLRQSPVIPEPGSILMLSIAMGLFCRRSNSRIPQAVGQ
jgi:hypothetical protein